MLFLISRMILRFCIENFSYSSNYTKRNEKVKFDLYTTPPRIVLRKDDSTSLFHAQLVPAAKVYLRLKESVDDVKNSLGTTSSILSDSILSQVDKCKTSFISEQNQRSTSNDDDTASAAGEQSQKDREAALLKNQQQQQQQLRNDQKGNSSGKPKWFKM